MSFVAAAVGGAVAIYSANAQAEAAKDAANAQKKAAKMGIREQQRQFDITQQNFAPYLQAGTQGLTGQQDILGLNGPEAQAAAIQAIQGSPQFSSMLQQGEGALLQNASATGGLRGGNTQGALMNFRPMLLNQLLSEQYNRLGGLAGMGQASAAGQANIGQQNANSISNLLAQQGAAQAGANLAQGQAASNIGNAAAQFVGTATPWFMRQFNPPNSGGGHNG